MTLDERELQRIAGRLGQGAAEGLDVGSVTRGVLGRLADANREDVEAEARRRPWTRRLAAAAAVVLIAAGALVTWQVEQPASGVDVQVATVGLYDLSSDELTEVLDSLRWHAPASVQVAGLDDLDAEQLDALLALMEG
jgi:hypothetical protein